MTYQPEKADQIQPRADVFEGRWESKVQREFASRWVKKVSTPLRLRKSLDLSVRQMAELLSEIAGWEIHFSTISKFEHGVAGHYERRHAHSRYMRAAYRALIQSYVLWRTNGRYTARAAMTGAYAKRWKVTLIRVKVSSER